jgi:hypothetical protein
MVLVVHTSRVFSGLYRLATSCSAYFSGSARFMALSSFRVRHTSARRRREQEFLIVLPNRIEGDLPVGHRPLALTFATLPL